MKNGRLLLAAIGILLAATLLILPERGVAQHWPCGSGPGPGERMIGMTQGGQGVASVPLCTSDGSGSSGPAPSVPVRVLDKSFGALAYNADAKNWMISYNHPTAQKAKSVAVGQCQQQYGGSCQLMLSFTNQCAAVARAAAPGEDSVNTGSSKEQAEANAIKSCRADWGGAACEVILSDCSKHSTRVVQ